MALTLQNRLVLVTPPAAEPLTLVEVKSHLRIEHSDDDSLIQRLIDVAVRFVDVQGSLGKAMITQTWAEWFAPNPSTITLGVGPVQSVSAIRYYDADNALQVATLSNFLVMGTPSQTIVKPKIGFTWPTVFVRDDAIKIEYVVGYGNAANDVPQTVRHALMMLVAHYYENRENELIGTISKTLPFGFQDLINAEKAGGWYG